MFQQQRKSSPVTIFFLLLTLRVDKLLRLLFDRNVSQVHSFLKNVHIPKLIVGHFALTDYFVSCFCISTIFCLDEEAFVSRSYQIALPHLNLARNACWDVCQLVGSITRFSSRFRPKANRFKLSVEDRLIQRDQKVY